MTFPFQSPEALRNVHFSKPIWQEIELSHSLREAAFLSKHIFWNAAGNRDLLEDEPVPQQQNWIGPDNSMGTHNLPDNETPRPILGSGELLMKGFTVTFLIKSPEL